MEVLDPFTVSFAALGLTGAGLGWVWYVRARRAESRLAELREELRVQRHAANHDPLTDLPNRRTFFHLGGALVEPPARQAVVVLLDLDDFKLVNDRYGHAAGDHVLATVARRLAWYADGNLVARLGGDEFAALFTGPVGDDPDRYPTAEALSDLVAAPISFGGHELTVTASVGLAELVEGISLVRALHQADLAMYQAKRHRTAPIPSTFDRSARLEEGGQAACPPPPSIPVTASPRTSPPPTATSRPIPSGSTGAAPGGRASSKRLLAAPRQ
jgi:diguanylate cyclase